MKGLLMTNLYHKGASTLELLIAFAVLISAISAAIMVSVGNQSIAIDTQTNAEALYRGKSLLENSRAIAKQDFGLVISNTSVDVVGGLAYKKTLSVSEISQCKKLATSTITWNESTARPQKIELSTYLTDIPVAFALGGDCASTPPTSSWSNPQRFANDTFNPGKPTAIDVLKQIAYLGLNVSPYFYIASTSGATLGQSGGLFVAFANSFDLLSLPNAIDAAYDPVTSKTHVFAAMNSATNQLRVIDVTDIYNPKVVATSSLDSTLIPIGERVSGSNPQGQIIYYYDHKIYIGLNRTAGSEFHVYDVATPSDPVWLGSREMNHNVKDIVVRGNYVYLAMTTSDSNDKELAVLDVSDPADILPHFVNGSPEPWGYNATGTEGGLSVYLLGNTLYLGRTQGSGSEADLMILNVSSPTTSITQLGSKTIGADINEIRVAGQFAFLGTSKTNKEFQIWNVTNPSAVTLIKEYNFGNNVRQGFDYEPDFIYATGLSTPNFQILYSP